MPQEPKTHEKIVNAIADKGREGLQAELMKGKEIGWYEGYWGHVDEEGKKHLGGSTFIPQLKRAGPEVKAPPRPYESRSNYVMYWDGKELSNSYHE